MMNWYKKANIDSLTNFLIQWFRSARDNVPDADVALQHIQALPEGMMAESEAIQNAMTAAWDAVRAEQGGDMTEHQASFMQWLTSLLMAPHQHTEHTQYPEHPEHPPYSEENDVESMPNDMGMSQQY